MRGSESITIRVWLVILAAVSMSQPARAAMLDQAIIWQCWEHALTSRISYANPYADVDLRVVFDGPTGQSLSACGFWDGGSTFRIRFAFPQTGIWTWRTTCSDPTDEGLHDQSGMVEVAPFAGDNALYRHGSLRVGDNARHLAHYDGTPFLWLGDTAWLAYVRATNDQWKAYIDDRRSRGFSVVVISCSCIGSKDDATDALGETPFQDNTMEQWNPAFWRSFERKIDYANKCGMVVVVVGVAWGKQAELSPREDVLAFSRNLAARLAGNHVVFSPRQDWGGGREDLLDESGQEIKRAAPLALVTQHPKRIPGEGAQLPMPDQVLKHYYHLPSTDFVSVQTGKGGVSDSTPLAPDQAVQATIQWIGALYNEAAYKPVVNLEGIYDVDYHFGISPEQSAMVRQQGYLSFLTGACGYVSSTYGVWAWGGPIQFGAKTQAPDLQTGMNRPYARDLSILATLLASIDWWRLEPAAELICNQAVSWSRRMALARTAKRDLLVAYLSDNNKIEVDLSEFPSQMTGRWFNPITGTFKAVSPFSGGAVRTFHRPSAWPEAVLLIETQSVNRPMNEVKP